LCIAELRSSATVPVEHSVMNWTTLITTADYACGVVCLARSLELVKSRAKLICYVTSSDVQTAVLSQRPVPQNLLVSVLSADMHDDVLAADLTRDHSQFIDATRRFLFLRGDPFVFLDSDMIVTSNIDDLLDMCTNGNTQGKEIIAVPNFRNKKKGYGDESGNFNAGMMVVPGPKLSDYHEIMRVLTAGYNDTEEKLLNLVFKGRWRALPIGYNCQKRAFKLAPLVWNDILLRPPGVKIVHYVGGKPWQSAEELRRLDWEASSEEAMQRYQPLFELWHKVFCGEFGSAEELAAAVPEAPLNAP
jgi:alpha-N-acetylglucosamine transferase